MQAERRCDECHQLLGRFAKTQPDEGLLTFSVELADALPGTREPVFSRKPGPVEVDRAVDDSLFRRLELLVLGVDGEDVEDRGLRRDFHRTLTKADPPSTAMLTSVPLTNSS